MKLNNSAYDTLKWVALIALPAIAVAVGGFGNLYNWDEASQTAGAIVIVDTLLGALLQLSSSQYNSDDSNFDGSIFSKGNDPDTGLPHLAIEVHKHPDTVLNGKVARLKVK